MPINRSRFCILDLKLIAADIFYRFQSSKSCCIVEEGCAGVIDVTFVMGCVTTEDIQRGEGLETTMPMDKVRRDQALSKSQFHQRLRSWLDDSSDTVVGPESVDGRTGWVHIRDGSDVFVLHADTRRDAVRSYLQLVTQYGDDLQWDIAESQRGKMTAVVYGPERLRQKSFYLYALGAV